tara:strand:- start:1380 stop:1574 length:195 start_codon:yes stop_codon:yes gene_type:complete
MAAFLLKDNAMNQIPTVKIKLSDDDYAIINQCDFIEGKHERFKEKAKAKAKAKTPTTTKKSVVK